MGVNKTVFCSNSERDNYYKLRRTWGDKYHIFQNLPYLNVFNIDDLHEYELTESDYLNLLEDPYNLDGYSCPMKVEISQPDVNRLKKSSIDYTICDLEDNPILCIEFDGMNDGYNLKGKYFPMKSKDEIVPWRKKWMDLKIHVATLSDFPYFVLGSEYFRYMRSSVPIMIVDGIIGIIVAHRIRKEEKENFDPYTAIGISKFDYEQLDLKTRAKLRGEWINMKMEEIVKGLNPFRKRIDQLRKDLNVSKENKSIEDFPPYVPNFDENDLKDNFPQVIMEIYNFFNNMDYFTCRTIYNTSDIGEVDGTITIPNFGVRNVFVPELAIYVSDLIALEKLYRQRNPNPILN